jgi:large subunit ribosomal protein L4
MKLPVLSIEGKELRSLEVDDSVFGIEPNGAVLHQAYVAQRNNQRAGTVKTKTRGEVQGSTRKVRMQKYTGRSRQGSARAPHRVGGGVVFGPRPRDYSQDMPKKMRRLAIRSALSGKVADGQLVVIDQLALEAPRTKEIVRILGNLGFNRSALMVTAGPDRGILASVRNLDRTKVLPAAYLNVGDMMNHAGLVMTEDAVRIAEGLWGQKGQKPAAPKPAAPKPAPARSRAEAKVEAEPEPEPVVEATAKPPAEPEAKAPARRRAAAKAEAAAEAPAEKPRRVAPKAAPAAEAPAEKPRRVAPKAAPAAEAPAEKPRRPAPRPKAESKPKAAPKAARPKTEAVPAAEKPKRRTTKKAEGE